jgi:hypothetical protein
LESNDAFTGCQPQYPDLRGCFNIDSKGLQEVFGTTRHASALTRHLPPAYSVIQEFVESFVEGSYMNNYLVPANTGDSDEVGFFHLKVNRLFGRL